MPTYLVEIQRTIIHEVKVKAKTPAAARKKIDKVDFPLPPNGEWEQLKDEEIIVRTPDGDEVDE